MSTRTDDERERFIRMEMLLGEDAANCLRQAKVAVFGIGGVGGYIAEALARSGVGTIDLIDDDKVAKSNINRQIIALSGAVGKYKADVMKERILEINPHATVNVFRCFFLPENKDLFDFSSYSYIADAVDTVTAKIELALQAKKYQIPIISSMGTGNKLNPAGFEVADIYETSVCPLAKVMRKELRKRGITSLKVVYSKEEPRNPKTMEEAPEGSSRRSIPGSTAFVPPVAGMIMAGEIIKDIAGIGNNRAYLSD